MSLLEAKIAYKGRKIIEDSTGSTFTVVSEPGDLTHYEYVVKRLSVDEFDVSSTFNHFAYPAHINFDEIYGEVDELEDAVILKMAKDEGCNPYTLAEVIAACHQINVADADRIRAEQEEGKSNE